MNFQTSTTRSNVYTCILLSSFSFSRRNERVKNGVRSPRDHGTAGGRRSAGRAVKRKSAVKRRGRRRYATVTWHVEVIPRGTRRCTSARAAASYFSGSTGRGREIRLLRNACRIKKSAKKLSAKRVRRGTVRHVVHDRSYGTACTSAVTRWTTPQYDDTSARAGWKTWPEKRKPALSECCGVYDVVNSILFPRRRTVDVVRTRSCVYTGVRHRGIHRGTSVWRNPLRKVTH